MNSDKCICTQDSSSPLPETSLLLLPSLPAPTPLEVSVSFTYLGFHINGMYAGTFKEGIYFKSGGSSLSLEAWLNMCPGIWDLGQAFFPSDGPRSQTCN